MGGKRATRGVRAQRGATLPTCVLRTQCHGTGTWWCQWLVILGMLVPVPRQREGVPRCVPGTPAQIWGGCISDSVGLGQGDLGE